MLTQLPAEKLAEVDCRLSLSHLTNEQLRDLDLLLTEEVRSGKGNLHYHDQVTVEKMLDMVQQEEEVRSRQ